MEEEHQLESNKRLSLLKLLRTLTSDTYGLEEVADGRHQAEEVALPVASSLRSFAPLVDVHVAGWYHKALLPSLDPAHLYA